MRGFEIFVAPGPCEGPSPSERVGHEDREPAASRPSRPVREVLDIFIGGANVTAFAEAAEPASTEDTPSSRRLRRVQDGSVLRANAAVAGVLRDLGNAAVALADKPRGKAIVRLYDAPWELCVERLYGRAALSVYRGGTEPKVAVYDRMVRFADVVTSLVDAIAGVLTRATAPTSVLLELASIHKALDEARDTDFGDAEPPEALPAVVSPEPGLSLSLGAEFKMREGVAGAPTSSVERTDLHALLFRGRLRACVRGRGVDLGEGHPFLVAERFLAVVKQSLDAWERGAPHHVRAEAGSVLLGVRVDADGSVALTLGAARGGGERAIFTFPALSVPELVDGAVSFGRTLARVVLRRDRSQATNLRLTGLRRQLREVTDQLREACRDDALVNPSPEPYRAFIAPLAAKAGAENRLEFSSLREAPAGRAAPALPARPPSRLRYSVRWRALVPGIDLRATFLCGDRLVVGAAAETFCLDRTTGEVLWRVPTERATSVVTPGGVARLHADGELCVHDFGTGEVTLRSWLAPRTGGPPAGAVVNVPGLPRLLILTEGERHFVAVDLSSGEPRWRFAWGKKGNLRLKRAGKLLYYTSGDTALTALDVLTGSVVWRARDRLRFRGAPVMAHDALFAVAGGLRSRANLVSVDAFSGQTRWVAPVSAEGSVVTVEGAPLPSSDSVAVVIEGRQGVKLSAWDRETGRPLWRTPAYVAPSGTSWLAVDDLYIGNTPTGELVAVEAETGETRYRHRLGTMLETDVPRRLEPVLRSGALFVPHADVHVVRPGDGAPVGTVGPCETIPDLLRVDERCDVYVAEESGHLASFAAGPRLSLVK